MTATPSLSTPAPAAAVRPSPWREVGVYLGTVAGLLTLTTSVAAAAGADVTRVEQAPPLVQALLYGQALIPLLAAVLARLATTGTLRRPGWGFRRTSWRSLGTAWLWALLPTLAAGVLLWVTGLAGFAAGGLTPVVPLGLTVLVLPYVVLALAEDVGWRGLLVQRLAEVAGPLTVVLVSGLAWSLFHWPLVLFLGGAPAGVPVWFALACLTVGTTSLGAVLASMQLRWGIWPGVLAHAVLNALLYHVLAPLTADSGPTEWLSTETGAMGAVTLLLAALAWWRVAPLVRAAGGGTIAR
ncbi:CAAX protease self-immunity [Geodermatophilus saharensis]|uniref:CAAX protease self-immunity n=1 Tax=Geodermatophilus saharensis TaxID=1137994 RepID=A0A239I246_9ACTN|nr:type II CAAX endopeptidase family protein [Geodermatophilus saharensis]SNS87561.1 CAAX protease self-immunity [Geodermatophilus saharensis]